MSVSQPTCKELERAEADAKSFFNSKMLGTVLFDNRGKTWDELRADKENTAKMDKLVFLWCVSGCGDPRIFTEHDGNVVLTGGLPENL